MNKRDKKTFTIMPIGEFEDYDVKDLYALYTSDRGIEIGILDPELVEDLPTIANIGGLEDTDDIALFVDATDVTDRPVYKIYPAINRTVGTYDILNGFVVSLDKVVTGEYKVGASPIKK